MRISDWSSDVCSSDLQTAIAADHDHHVTDFTEHLARRSLQAVSGQDFGDGIFEDHVQVPLQEETFEPANGVQHLRTAQATDDADIAKLLHGAPARVCVGRKTRLWAKAAHRQNSLSLRRRLCSQNDPVRSEEHQSELQSLMRISYAVFC